MFKPCHQEEQEKPTVKKDEIKKLEDQPCHQEESSGQPWNQEAPSFKPRNQELSGQPYNHEVPSFQPSNQ